MKKRIDLLLVEKKNISSRNKAQAMIMAGQVYVENKKVLKSEEIFDSDIEISISNLHPEWVSRGSIKLIHAIRKFDLNFEKYTCLDFGASTGGFTEVLLNQKAKKIYAVDVGKNQLHEKLRKEKKIINLEKTNARYLNEEIIKEKIQLIVCDVSFISLKKVIFPCIKFLSETNGKIIALIKPQFEAKKNEIKKGGIIKDTKVHNRVCDEIKDWFINECNMNVKGLIESPIKGFKGNKEFLILAEINYKNLIQ